MEKYAQADRTVWLDDPEMHARDAAQLAQQMPWFTRILVRLFARRLNRDVFYPVLGRALERGVIKNDQFYRLHRHFDPTQHGLIGIVVGR